MQQQIGRYQVLEEIASGGQGAVYRAFDPQTRQIVALKVLHPSLTGDTTFLERFHREARITASIDNPNVVKIFEVGEDGGRHFISMEFLPESLGRVLERGGGLPSESSAVFAIQIANGLSAAHRLGVVHRDVKPPNVLINQDGTAKVADFGIARAEVMSTMTATGAVMGTPHYMSPEQCRGEQADARSDVYSLGCVLYQMLTGELPFQGTTPLAVIRQHIEDRPPPIRQLRTDVPRALRGVAERAMEKEPGDRFQSMEEMASALSVAVPEAARATQSVVSEVSPVAGQPGSETQALVSSVAAAPEPRSRPKLSGLRRFVYGAAAVVAVWYSGLASRIRTSIRIRNGGSASIDAETQPVGRRLNERKPASSTGTSSWLPNEVLNFSISKWKELGGTIELPPSGRWYKLVHPDTSTSGACVVIDLKNQTFDHFTNVRVRTLDRWLQVFGEVADGFDPYFPPDRGITTKGRSNRIECELKQIPEWQDYVCRFLELCRDYWISARQQDN